MRHISFPTGLGCSHFPPVFLLSLLHKVERFFIGFPAKTTDNFFTQHSLRLRREAIVMSWLWDLPMTWSWHVTTHIISSHNLDTWPIRTSSHYHQVIIDTNICVIISMSWLHPDRSFITFALLLHPGLLITTTRVFSLSLASSRCSEVHPDSNSGGVRGGYLDYY